MIVSAWAHVHLATNVGVHSCMYVHFIAMLVHLKYVIPPKNFRSAFILVGFVIGEKCNMAKCSHDIQMTNEYTHLHLTEM